MSESILSARDGVELIDRAVVLSLRHYWTFLRLALVPFLGYVVCIRLFAQPGFPLLVRVVAYVCAIGMIGVVRAIVGLGVWESLHARPIDIGAAWNRTLRRGFSAFVATIAKSAIILAGLVAFVVPGIYALAAWFAVPSVTVIEDLEIVPSFTRSAQLAQHAIAGVLTANGLVYLIVVIASYALPLGAVRLGISRVSIVTISASFALDFLTIPIREVTAILTYFELRVRKEGYDLQGALERLPLKNSPSA